MSARVVAAVLRMEFLRARRVTLWGGGIAVAGTIGAFALENGPALVSAFVVFFTVASTVLFAPIGALLTEKLMGTMELDRTLPVPTRVLATARLLAAAVRTLPLLLLLAIAARFASREVAAFGVTTLVFAVVAVQVLYWSAMWIGYGLLARFSFKKLVWLPATLWFAALVTPDAVVSALFKSVGERATTLLMAALADPSRLPPLGVAVLGVAALCFGIALLLLTSGLRRFEPDPLALQGVVEKVPREELTPVGRGVLTAIIRLRLRLVAPQIRREMMFVAAMVAVLLAESFGVAAVGPLAEISRIYLPVLAFLMPGSVGMHLMPARQLGTIEGLQQLPYPRRDVALGHLSAVLILSVPAVVIWTVAQVIEGSAPGAERLLRVWLAIGATAWVIAAFMVWATARRVVIAAIIVIGLPTALFFGGRWLLPKLGLDLSPHLASLLAFWAEHKSWLATTVTLVGFVALVTAGLAMFTHGLRTYQPKAQ